MRRFLTAALVLCVFATVFVDAPAAEESGSRLVKTILLSIKCDGQSMFNDERLTRDSSVSLSKSGGDTAMFRLLGSSDVDDTVTVEPKDGHEWPFDDAPPSFGIGGGRSTGSIRADIAPGTSYGYSLVYTCDGDRREIDPKMDIDG